VRLHLWEIVVWSVSALDELLGVVEKVQSKVEQAAGDWLSVNSEMRLVKMPSSRTADESWESTVGSQFVPLLALFEINLLADGVV
jgi:hypothetical protein